MIYLIGDEVEKYDLDAESIDLVLAMNHLKDNIKFKKFEYTYNGNVFMMFSKSGKIKYFLLYLDNKSDLVDFYKKVIERVANKWILFNNSYTGIESVLVKKEFINRIFGKLGLVELLI